MKKNIIALSLVILSLFSLISFNVYACNYNYDEGVSINPINSKDKLNVIKEDITFNILKENIINDNTYFDMSNKYTIKNDEDTVKSTKIYVPYMLSYNDSLSKRELEVKIDDNIITPNKRYLYFSKNTYEDITDEYITSSVINKDTFLYHYSYRIDYDLSNREVLHVRLNNNDILNNLYTSYSKEYDFYSVKELNESMINVSKYNYFSEKETNLDVDLNLKLEGTTTYYDYLMSIYNSVLEECSGLSILDFVNASIYKTSNNNHINYANEYDLSAYLEYDLSINPNSMVTTEIILPIIPRTNYNYTPYNYEFDLDFTKSNLVCDDITVNIKTDIYLTLNNVDYLKEDNVYSFKFNNLSDLNFSFTANQSENPDYGASFPQLNTFVVIILIVIFFISIMVPVTVLLVIFIFKKKLYKGLNLLYLLEGIIFTVVGYFTIIAIEEEINLLYLGPCIIFFLSIIPVIIEKVKYHHTIFLKLILYIIYLIVFTLLMADYDADSLMGIAVTAMVLSIILYIICLINLLLKDKEISNNNYPEAIICYKGFVITRWLITIYISLFLSINIIFDDLDFYVTIIFVCAILITLFVYLYINSYYTNRYFNEYHKDLDYLKLKNNINKLLENPKLHPETRNYYNMQMFIYSITVDLEDAKMYKELLFVPKNKTYRLMYDALLINYLLNYDELESIVNEFIHTHKSKRAINNAKAFLTKQKLYFLDEEVSYYDKICPINTKNNFSNAWNMYILIFYLKKHNDLKAKELEREFRFKYKNLKVLIDDLDGIDIREKYKSLFNEEVIIENNEDITDNSEVIIDNNEDIIDDNKDSDEKES